MSTPSLELTTLPTRPARAPEPGPALAEHERDRLIRRAKTLSWLSLAYMTVEGAVAMTAAILAGSVALLGFGLDSAIEGFASVIVIWRFTGRRRLSANAEERAQRMVAVSFFLLAPFIAQDALRALTNADHPSTSWIGIGLSISSMLVMPLLGGAKHRVGSQLGSSATAGEGTQNMLCAYLAAGVLVGLALNTAFGLWWADPSVAVGIAALAIKEGRETWRGEGCCATTTIGADADHSCHDHCCTQPAQPVVPAGGQDQ